jgi:hypothetical protein
MACWHLSFFGQKKEYAMVMGYFDESADSHDSDFMCMSGYLADDAYFEALTRDWNGLLVKYKLKSLHLADFMHMTGQYSGLRWSERKIDKVLKEFIGIIRRHTIAGIGVGLDAKAYRVIAKSSKKRISPQVFCFERVLKLTINRLAKWNWVQPVCMIFDDSESYSMACYHSYCDVRRIHPEAKDLFAGIAFGNDDTFAPLQAADLLAYATTIEQRRGKAAWTGKNRIFHGLLLDDNPAFGKLYDSEHWDKEKLEEQELHISRVANRDSLLP